MADVPSSPEDEEEQPRRAAPVRSLEREIAERWDPDRLARIVVDRAGRGDRLDAATQSEMERRVGGRFGDVRVYRGRFAEEVTRRHRADAVTVANTGMILVREGPRSDPKSAAGKALLAHELTHVRQAQRGLHFALEGGASQGAAHEREAEAVEAQVHADAVGARAVPARDVGALRRRVVSRTLEIISEEDDLAADRRGGRR